MTLIDTHPGLPPVYRPSDVDGPDTRKDFEMSSPNILLRSTETALSKQPPEVYSDVFDYRGVRVEITSRANRIACYSSRLTYPGKPPETLGVHLSQRQSVIDESKATIDRAMSGEDPERFDFMG